MDELADSLASAVGDSRFVVAAFLDVRGFSRFAGIAESVQAAIFLKKFYLGVLKDFLPGSTFAKPTGDGLMVIYEYEEDSVIDVVNTVVAGSLKLMKDYPSFLLSDPMITFDVPPDIGIGIARDAATRISSAGGTLDYSGRPLNLAARLMDLARPRGVVLDSYVAAVSAKEHLAGFTSEKVFLRGVAQDIPREIRFNGDWTQIQEESRHPVAAYEWFSEPVVAITLGELRHRGSSFTENLTHEPAYPEQIHVRVGHKKVLPSGRASKSIRSWTSAASKYSDLYGRHSCMVNFDNVCKDLASKGVKDTWKLEREIAYKIRKS